MDSDLIKIISAFVIYAIVMFLMAYISFVSECYINYNPDDVSFYDSFKRSGLSCN